MGKPKKKTQEDEIEQSKQNEHGEGEEGEKVINPKTKEGKSSSEEEESEEEDSSSDEESSDYSSEDSWSDYVTSKPKKKQSSKTVLKVPQKYEKYIHARKEWRWLKFVLKIDLSTKRGREKAKKVITMRRQHVYSVHKNMSTEDFEEAQDDLDDDLKAVAWAAKAKKKRIQSARRQTYPQAPASFPSQYQGYGQPQGQSYYPQQRFEGRFEPNPQAYTTKPIVCRLCHKVGHLIKDHYPDSPRNNYQRAQQPQGNNNPDNAGPSEPQ